jgi:quercetin dioxygenase-like cupin family protein
MTVAVSSTDLPPLVSPRGPVPGRRILEGVQFGLQCLTLIVGETEPGQGIALHSHDYEELFLIHAGVGTYTVGDDTVKAGPGDIVIVPSGVPHRFINNAQEPLRHTAVHSSGILKMEYRDRTTRDS